MFRLLGKVIVEGKIINYPQGRVETSELYTENHVSTGKLQPIYGPKPTCLVWSGSCRDIVWQAESYTFWKGANNWQYFNGESYIQVPLEVWGPNWSLRLGALLGEQDNCLRAEGDSIGALSTDGNSAEINVYPIPRRGWVNFDQWPE